MVAEPTLFLTKDREVQVRTSTTKRGKEVFCVKDFIRQTADKLMGPNDAVIYWLSCLGKLMHEAAILDQYMIRFPGPYEQPQVCLRAEGLLLLYTHMCERFNWVKKEYQAEIRNTLFTIIETKTAAAYVELFDDGEVDALLVERGDRALACPPSGSKFIYVEPEVDVRIQAAEAEKERVVNELIAKLEAKSLALDEANARLKEQEGDRETKKRKRDGFKLSDLVDEQGEHVLVGCKDAFCKKVMATFKTRYPDRETFKRHGAVHLFNEDRAVAEQLIKEEYAHLIMEEAVGE
jgi:hypothetical protein